MKTNSLSKVPKFPRDVHKLSNHRHEQCPTWVFLREKPRSKGHRVYSLQAYDERIAAQTAGIDQRPLTQKEIVKHLEQFGALGAGEDLP